MTESHVLDVAKLKFKNKSKSIFIFRIMCIVLYCIVLRGPILKAD